MKRNKSITLIVLSVLVVFAGLRLLVAAKPLNLDVAEWHGIEKCAENQRSLFQTIEWELKENGRLPDEDFRIDGFRADSVWKCPACERGYKLDLENFGDPRAVVITDERDAHPTTFTWWLRGLHPEVRTMGDGKIQLFKDWKVLTMVGSRRGT